MLTLVQMLRATQTTAISRRLKLLYQENREVERAKVQKKVEETSPLLFLMAKKDQLVL
jgi:hypothetical protein